MKPASPRNPGEGKSSETRDQQSENSALASIPQDENAKVLTGAEEPTPAVVGSGGGVVAADASEPSPAPRLDVGYNTTSKPQRELPPGLRALCLPSSKWRPSCTCTRSFRIQKAHEIKHPSHFPASPVPGTVEAIVEALSTSTNTGKGTRAALCPWPR